MRHLNYRIILIFNKIINLRIKFKIIKIILKIVLWIIQIKQKMTIILRISAQIKIIQIKAVNTIIILWIKSTKLSVTIHKILHQTNPNLESLCMHNAIHQF